MIRPAQGGIGQGFSTAHQAVDIGSSKYFGTPIVAPHAGIITAAGQMGSGTNDAGLAIDVTSHDGVYKSRLAHNDQILVSVGQHVSEGQRIGVQGYTGYTIPDNSIGGTHCHWVLWINGVRVNPLDHVTEEGEDIVRIENTAAWKTRMSQVLKEITGDDLTNEEFKAWVNAEPFSVVEALIDDKQRAAKNDSVSDADSRIKAFKDALSKL